MMQEHRYWEVIAESEWPVFLRQPRVESCVIGKCKVQVNGKRTILISHVRAQNEYDAEQRAMSLFDEIVVAKVFSDGLHWHLRMQVPTEIEKERVDEDVLVEATPDKVYSIRGTQCVSQSPLISKTGITIDPEQLEHWLQAIRQTGPKVKKLVNYFVRGVVLSQHFPEEAFLCFIRIVEAFAEDYKQKLIEKNAKEWPDMHAFRKGLFAVARKYFPNLSDAKLEQILSQIRGQLFYTNRELIEFLCIESGYFDKILSRRKTGLKELMELIYSYLPQEQRQREFEESYAEHYDYITTSTPRILSHRRMSAHFTQEDEVSRSAVRDCSRLAHYLMLQEMQKQGIAIPEAL